MFFFVKLGFGLLELVDVVLQPGAHSFCQGFAAGEITVVLGANRSGKTNLCRLVAGLPTQAQGRVILGGADISTQPTGRRAVAMVYQEFVNYPNLTVAQNIASPLIARNWPVADIEPRIEELVQVLGLAELKQRLPSELSGGQQQRLAIARAMAKDAQVLLLDEPLVNLDFKLRESLEVEMRELLRRSNTAVVYTSSDPRDAFSLGDQVMLLERGHLMQAGSTLQVYNEPASFACMDLLSDPGVNKFREEGKVKALRPEHISMVSKTEALGDVARASFEMRVTAFETSGDESFIHGRVSFVPCADTTPTSASKKDLTLTPGSGRSLGQDEQWVVRLRGMPDVSVGDLVDLHARQADVRVFNYV